MKKHMNAYRAAARRELGVRAPKIPPSKVVVSKKKKEQSRSRIKAETRKQIMYY